MRTLTAIVTMVTMVVLFSAMMSSSLTKNIKASIDAGNLVQKSMVIK